MNAPLTLSRYKLSIFTTCQRKFQARYLLDPRWPLPPPAPPSLEAEQGIRFHALMQRHFSGLPLALETESEAVQSWWQAFQDNPPRIPAGDIFPEYALSVPIVADESLYLFGRFDLLVLTEKTATIIDWKTERTPRSPAKLKADLQTQLYLAALVEGGNALRRSYTPEQVTITYWFARHPQKSVTIPYDTATHTQSWARLTATANRLQDRLAAPDAIWPLTDDREACKKCNFQALCDRRTPSTEEQVDESIIEMYLEDLSLVPELNTSIEPQLPNS